jgi:biopolymer transport protein ExbD
MKRKRYLRRKSGYDGHLSLIPFIDMLTIMVVFLLVHTSDTDVLPNNKNISIPESISETKPRPTVVVMVTKDDLLVNGQSVARIQDVTASQEAVIASLKTALMNQAARVLDGGAKDDVERREVTILGDRNVPYSVLRKIMATCTDAEYGKVSLAVVESERPNATRATQVKSG